MRREGVEILPEEAGIMYLLAFALLTASPSLHPLLPSPHDNDGWGLRAHNFSVGGPFLVSESIDLVRFDVTLINFSKEKRKFDPFVVMRQTGALDIDVFQPDGSFIGRLGDFLERDKFTQQEELAPGQFASTRFIFGEFGLGQLHTPGKHRLECTLKMGRTTIKSPPIVFDVVDVPEFAVVASHTIQFKRYTAKLMEKDYRAAVQQIRIGKQTILVYRVFRKANPPGGVWLTARLAELPGKTDVTIVGLNADGRQLTIRYKDAKSKTGWTTLVVSPIDGSPWRGDD